MKLEDLKVGQYIRFKDKRGNTYIRNIKEVCNEQSHKSWGAIIIDKNANNVPYVSLKNIIKASYNIIDILEVGDYVNGLKITSVDKTFDGNKLIGLGKNFGFSKFDNDYKITSIVTHEQMEQMSYEIEQ